MTKYTISKLKEGKEVILHVSGSSEHFSVKNCKSKEEFNQKAKQYKLGRHFVTAVGFIKGGNSSDSLSLLFLDSYDAKLHLIGESRYIMKTSDDKNHNNNCPNEKPYYIQVYE